MSPKISEIEAGEIARQLILEKKTEVASLEPIIRDTGDDWAVVFDLVVPDDQVQCPFTIIICVDKTSGIAEIFRGL